ncbi:cupin domain-containing protein [Bordetella genomosp. 12]|uniref:Cupin n=1 Tax=Bordetella genomosp. 12 TaxID=463035 RepID=A0A261VLR3_9BORD|nr:cupin domain-containing protein [Bordetella genomosp. 12]OZI75078.1 cupin [Bordetella genomosp. 12]
MSSATPPLLPVPQVLDSLDQFFFFAHDGRVASLGCARRRPQSVGWLAGLKEARDSASVHGDIWERHTEGDELLCVLAGHVIVHWRDEAQGGGQVDLPAGKTALMPRGLWHRLEPIIPSRIFFMTPAQGGEYRKQEF